MSIGFLLGFTGFSSRLEIEFHWVLPIFTGFYEILLGFIRCYLVLLGFTGFYWVLSISKTLDWVSLRFTGFYWVSPS